ncbi:sigma-70 family RNA polymerase sigma factor [Ornithinibacillus halotolerans]|uniref:RNA polymerase subunit sigma n=1 Tax=Ornithinibacillus halotolerans TaxID=1274357 RepID=A0A916S2D3_9BACI|nr:sigma-70 family RNA polymerase sigma factor [Ornithinibacillus halotolerans]GGA80393.1 RNA polymerase subunit sigma [Ornithinibacillus halotolerans]
MNELEQSITIDENVIEKESMIEQLMDEYADGILHLVYTYVKNRTTAEDLTQEIFMKCYEKYHQFDHKANVKSWAYRVAINHCKDYLRSWHYRKINLNEKIWDYIPSRSTNVEKEVIEKEEGDSLVDAVMTLPVIYREVVFLHYYEELTLTEISNVTSVNINTLKTRLKRAKELLKDKLGGLLDE